MTQIRRFEAILALFVILQILFWYKTYEIKPKLAIVPPLICAEKYQGTQTCDSKIEALSFGDRQFYFRALAMQLQMAGDTFGRSTPLKDYNYKDLLQWFRLLDTLDGKSNYVPSMAAYYFSRSQHHPDVKYVVDYLEERSMKDPEANWWWLSQSIYLTNSLLGDKQRAIRIANALHKVKADIPLWARQMEVFLREDLGEKKDAERIMCDTFQQAGHLKDAPKREQDFMIYFFQTRMKEAMKDKSLEDVAELCARKYYSKQK